MQKYIDIWYTLLLDKFLNSIFGGFAVIKVCLQKKRCEVDLLVYRYDGRGHLHDLRPHDADNVPLDRRRLSEEEQRIEALCDEERYLELHTDLVEKAMYEGRYLPLSRCTSTTIYMGCSKKSYEHDEKSISSWISLLILWSQSLE